MDDWVFAPLRPFAYDVIVADPPWLVKLRSQKGEAKAPQAHYRCMTIDQISALPVNNLTGGEAWLFLWTSAPLLDRGFDVMRAWGFRYCSRFSWRKTTVNGKVRLGPGFVVRTTHEDILIGKIGEPPYDKALISLFDGEAREHSRKPESFYSKIEAFAPGARRLDLFSRASRPGWTAWGDEAGKFNGEAA